MANNKVRKIRLSTDDKIFYTVSDILLGLLLLIILYPLIFVVSSSFSAPNAVLSGKVGEHTSESCAFDHADVAHFYPSFEITTNEIDGVARITAIRLTTDMVETPQGLKIGMREEDAANAFPALKDADWSLADGTALLSVTIVDGKVAEIVYTPSISED